MTNFEEIIKDRYSGNKKIIKVKFYSIFLSVMILLVINFGLYSVAFNDIQSENQIIKFIDFYIYWLIFFNNIIIPFSILHLYYILKDNINIIFYSGEKQNKINYDDTLNL